jgi:hypothetical protein
MDSVMSILFWYICCISACGALGIFDVLYSIDDVVIFFSRVSAIHFILLEMDSEISILFLFSPP